MSFSALFSRATSICGRRVLPPLLFDQAYGDREICFCRSLCQQHLITYEKFNSATRCSISAGFDLTRLIWSNHLREFDMKITHTSLYDKIKRALWPPPNRSKYHLHSDALCLAIFRHIFLLFSFSIPFMKIVVSLLGSGLFDRWRIPWYWRSTPPSTCFYRRAHRAYKRIAEGEIIMQCPTPSRSLENLNVLHTMYNVCTMYV